MSEVPRAIKCDECQREIAGDPYLSIEPQDDHRGVCVVRGNCILNFHGRADFCSRRCTIEGLGMGKRWREMERAAEDGS